MSSVLVILNIGWNCEVSYCIYKFGFQWMRQRVHLGALCTEMVLSVKIIDENTKGSNADREKQGNLLEIF